MDSHTSILKLLKTLDGKALIVSANNINQRAALNRLAYHRGYSTRAINWEGRKENYLYVNGGYVVRFCDLDWSHEDKDDYDYHNFDDDTCLIYYWDKAEREEEFSTDESIVGLDYNAVIIYPNTIKATYKHKAAFTKKIEQFHGRNYTTRKSINVVADEVEIMCVNGILNFETEVVELKEYLITN